MCTPPDPCTPKTAPSRRRRRIWEINPEYHCMICGTCLGVDELRKLVAKANLSVPADTTDFRIHGRVVQMMSQPGALARAVQKALDRKFHLAIKRAARLSEEAELRAWWVESVDRGEIAGPCWALMTHALAKTALTVELFGEIHMMSHLEGWTNRAYKRRLAALERAAGAAAEDAAAARRRLAGREREIDDLRERLREAQAAGLRSAELSVRLERIESGAERRALMSRMEALERAADAHARERDGAHRRLAERSAELDACRHDIESLRRALADAEDECESLAAMAHDAAPAAASGVFDLAGRGVVYIGGRAGLLRHFRAFVESANGRFFHHDGGIEDNGRALECTLSRGDVVLCPVNCVSHGACRRAKRFCKQTARPFAPLRSAGLSAFVKGVREVAATP